MLCRSILQHWKQLFSIGQVPWNFLQNFLSLKFPWFPQYFLRNENFLQSGSTVYEPQTGIEPATFWWPVRRSNHWAMKTKMASWGVSSTYVQPKRFRDILMLLMRYICWKCGRLERSSMNDRWTIVKLLPQKNDFWAPDGDQTRNWWDALTIELPRLRWRAEVQARHMCNVSGNHDILISIIIINMMTQLHR